MKPHLKPIYYDGILTGWRVYKPNGILGTRIFYRYIWR